MWTSGPPIANLRGARQVLTENAYRFVSARRAILTVIASLTGIASRHGAGNQNASVTPIARGPHHGRTALSASAGARAKIATEGEATEAIVGAVAAAAAVSLASGGPDLR